MTETVKMPENWPEVLESRAAAAYLGDTSGTIDLLRMTADFIRATRSDPAVRDKVKPLEWKQFTERAGDLSASSVVGEYVIRPGNKGGAHFRLWTPGMDYNAALRFLSVPEAKAAAQADYEQRILSAFEPRTSPPEPASGLPERCPHCGLHWGHFPPGIIPGSEQVRCFECKSLWSPTPPAKEPQ